LPKVAAAAYQLTTQALAAAGVVQVKSERTHQETRQETAGTAFLHPLTAQPRPELVEAAEARLGVLLELAGAVAAVMVQTVRPPPAQQEQPILAVEAAVADSHLILSRDRTAALAALASSSSVTHSVWHKDFK
jgi:hypothetical protein